MTSLGRIWLVLTVFLIVILVSVGLWAVQRLGGWDATFYRLRHKGLSGVYECRKSLFEVLTGDENDIIWLGDSLTEKGAWSELFGDSRHKNRGINGDYADGILKRLPTILEKKPKAIILMVGTNDLLMGMKPAILINYYRKVVERILTQSPSTKLVIESVLPINNEKWVLPDKNKDILKFNELLQELTKEKGLEYIDLHQKLVDDSGLLNDKYTFDGIHLSGEAYLVWKKTLDPVVEQL